MFDVRKLLQSTISSDTELQELAAPAELIVVQRSGFIETQPPKTKPFIIHNLGASAPAGISAMRAHSQMAQIWVHDRQGDYGRIDQMHARIKVLLEAVEPQGEFLEMRMTFRSPDLSDLGLDTNVRFATYHVAMSPGGL